jgi:hypothetical protein
VIPTDAPCDLCSLPVGVRPFLLATDKQTLKFCCEGCLGIYQMLHDINEIPTAPEQNMQNNPERSPR